MQNFDFNAYPTDDKWVLDYRVSQEDKWRHHSSHNSLDDAMEEIAKTHPNYSVKDMYNNRRREIIERYKRGRTTAIYKRDSKIVQISEVNVENDIANLEQRLGVTGEPINHSKLGETFELADYQKFELEEIKKWHVLERQAEEQSHEQKKHKNQARKERIKRKQDDRKKDKGLDR